MFTAAIAALLLVMAGLLTLFAVLLIAVAEAPFVVALPFGAFAAFLLSLMLGMVRSATIVEPDRITVRDMGTRRMAWRDITAIEIEENPIVSDGKTKYVECVAVYSRDGRRTVLPNLADSRKRSMHREARVIREIWERGRGEDWTPDPAATDAGKARSAAGARIEGAALGAMGWGLTAVRMLTLGIVVVCVIAVATGRADDVPDIPGWVFVAVFAGVGGAPLVFLLLAALPIGRGRGR